MIPRWLPLWLFLAPALLLPLRAQPAKPIDRAGLMEAVRLRGLGTAEMVEIIREIGVDFRLRPEDEQELARLGADPRLIEAVRANYRGAGPAPPPAAAELPDGPPLSREQVVLILQAGVEHAVLLKLIEKRGAAFAMNRETAAAILAAGGSNAIVGAVAVSQREPAAAAAPPAQAAGQPAPSGRAPSSGPPVVRTPGPEQARKLIRHTPPEYPVMASRMGTSGKVLLGVRIGADGRVIGIQVLSGPSLLSSSAVAAVRSWVYEPTLVNGVPAEVLTEVEVNFTLKK